VVLSVLQVLFGNFKEQACVFQRGLSSGVLHYRRPTFTSEGSRANPGPNLNFFFSFGGDFLFEFGRVCPQHGGCGSEVS